MDVFYGSQHETAPKKAPNIGTTALWHSASRRKDNVFFQTLEQLRCGTALRGARTMFFPKHWSNCVAAQCFTAQGQYLFPIIGGNCVAAQRFAAQGQYLFPIIVGNCVAAQRFFHVEVSFT